MVKKSSQIWLYQAIKSEKRKKDTIKIDKKQILYIKQFVTKNLKLFKVFVFLLIIQVILEIFLPLLARNYLSNLSLQLEKSSLIAMIIILSIGLIIYLIISFFSIKTEKTFIIEFINSLRRKWFKIFAYKKDDNIKENKKAGLIAKITYHFPLLQMGVNNSFLNSIKWIVYFLGVLILAFLSSTKLLIIVLVALPINLIIIYIGYLIAKIYVSKETTLYSDIIKHITNSLYNLKFIEKNKNYKQAEKKLDNLVKLDTYFRVHRDLWIIFGNKIIFAILILIISLSYLLQIYFPKFWLQMSPEEVIVSGLIFIYLSRLTYISLRIGLFLFPLKLGIYLSVPTHTINKLHPGIKKIKTLEFISPKVKLYKKSGYLKNINIKMSAGNRLLIYGNNFSGKTKLANVILGRQAFNPNAWIVKINNKREKYHYWQNSLNQIYFIEPNFYSENTLLEVILGKYKESLTKEQVLKTIEKIINHQEFKFLTTLNNFPNTNLNQLKLNPLQSFTVQAAYCLINKPAVIIVDNLWLDLAYENIINIIKLLEKELTNSIIINFSTNDNNALSYDQKYQIQKEAIQKVL